MIEFAIGTLGPTPMVKTDATPLNYLPAGLSANSILGCFRNKRLRLANGIDYIN